MFKRNKVAKKMGAPAFSNQETTRRFIDNCISALEDEIQAAEHTGGSKRTVALANGRFQRTIDRTHIYVFVASDGMPPSYEDAPVQILVSGQEIDGSVVGIEEFEVIIALEEYVGMYVATAELVVDLTFILEKLRELLTERASALEVHDVTLKVFGFGQPRISLSSAKHLSADECYMNEAQKHALGKCLGSDFVMVWGPPGTGKTHVLARVLGEQILQGQSIALLSNTNIAVDQALEQLLKLCENNERLKCLKDEGKIIRLGTPQLESVLSITLDRMAERIASQLKDELTRLKRRRDRRTKRLEQVRSRIKRLRELLELHRRLNEVVDSEKRIAHELKKVCHQYHVLADELLALNLRLSVIQKRRRLLRLIYRSKQRRLEQLVTQKEEGCRKINENMRKLTEKVLAHRAEVEKLRQRMATLTNGVVDPAKWETCLARLTSLETRLQNEMAIFAARIHELEIALQTVEARILNEALLVGCTCAKSTLDVNVSSRRFSTVAVDESSMVSLPQTLWCTNLANKRFLCFGDFRQLPPITLIKPDSGQESYEIMHSSIFERHRLGESLQDALGDPRVALLNEQYRMNPEICELVNKWMYGGRLITVPGTGCGAMLSQDPPLALVDTSLFGAWSDKNADFSWYNWHHAFVVLELVRELRNDSGAQADQGALVLILTPYRAQVRLIRALLEEADLQENARVSTVWGCQGTEASVVIFDTVCAPPYSKPGRWFLHEPGPADGARLINVAITRAKDKLYIVGHRQHLVRSCPSTAFIRKILDCLIANDHIIDSREIAKNLIPEEPADDGGFPIGAFGTASFKLFDQETFLEAFISDLCQLPPGSRITIFRPFLSGESFARCKSHFCTLLKNGCSIELFTRDRSAQNRGRPLDAVDSMIDELERLGAKVGIDSYLRGQRFEHHKLAFLEYPQESDRRSEPVIWIDSKRILGHRSGWETMLRIQSRNVYSVFASIIGLEDRRKHVPVHVLISKLENTLQRQLQAICPVHKLHMKLRFSVRSSKKSFFMCCPTWSKSRCDQKMNVSVEELNKALEFIRATCLEPGCDAPLDARRGREGIYIRCSEGHYVPLISYFRR